MMQEFSRVMNRVLAIAMLLMCLSATAVPVSAESPETIASAPPSAMAPLRAGVQYLVDTVPADLFGHWQRRRHVVETNAPQGFFSPEDRGLWTISRLGNKVYFLNPQNGVRTEIKVEQVVNDTATFSYDRSLAKGEWCHEELTLTPEFDHLFGSQRKTCYRMDASGEPVEYFTAIASVEGQRANSLPPLR